MHINACHRLLIHLLLVSSAISLCSDQQPATAPGSVSSGLVEVDGGKLYYEESGQGHQTVVLIHDGVVNSAVWNDVWPEFCKHFHTILLVVKSTKHFPG